MNSKLRFLTAPFRVFPNTIILGEAKCGTTSLYRYLNQLPQFLGSDVKEPNNFREFGGSPLFCRMHYPTMFTAALKTAVHGTVCAAEASAEYFSKPPLPETVHGLLPQVKCICLFRDPAKRAYSDWQMLSRAKKETRDFEDIIEHSLAFFERPDHELLLASLEELEYHPLRFIARGQYVRALRRWKRVFPHEQILCLNSDAFFQHPETVVQEVCTYLGLDADTTSIEWEARKKGKYTETLDKELYRKLSAFYAPWNQELERETGMSFAWGPADS